MGPDLVFLAVAGFVGSPLAAAGYWVAARWRARRRNAAERCGGCTGPLYAAGAFEGPSLVEGILHCAPCAARLRSRVGAGLALTGVWAAAVTAVAAGGVVTLGAPFLPLAALVLGEVAVMGGGAVLYMRRQNRLALRAMERRGEITAPAG